MSHMPPDRRRRNGSTVAAPGNSVLVDDVVSSIPTYVQLPVNVVLFCRAERALGDSGIRKKKVAAEGRFKARGASAGGCMGNSRQLEKKRKG